MNQFLLKPERFPRIRLQGKIRNLNRMVLFFYACSIYHRDTMLQSYYRTWPHLSDSFEGKSRVKNGHIRNGHILNNLKKLRDIDMDEYVAVGIHEAMPTTNHQVEEKYKKSKHGNGKSSEVSSALLQENG